MNPEQIVRDGLGALNDHDAQKSASYFANDLVVNGLMPMPLDKAGFTGLNAANLVAFPDWHFDIRQVQVNGNQATVTVQVTGTQNGPLNIPGMPSIPPSGKKISTPDKFTCTVGDDGKVHQLDFATPPNGGFPEALRQLGVQLPGM